MRHGKLRRKMGVKSAHRKALLRNLVRNLVISKRIQTTLVKAKEASAFSDSMVELAKKGDLHARRVLISKLGCAQTADRLIKEIAPQFKDRKGGYTRVLRLGNRPGDNAQKALLEFTATFEVPEDKKKAKKGKKKPKAEAPAKEKETKPKKTAEKTPKAKEAEEAPEKAAEKKENEKKESEKKGGFLGTLRKFLKGDE